MLFRSQHFKRVTSADATASGTLGSDVRGVVTTIRSCNPNASPPNDPRRESLRPLAGNRTGRPHRTALKQSEPNRRTRVRVYLRKELAVEPLFACNPFDSRRTVEVVLLVGFCDLAGRTSSSSPSSDTDWTDVFGFFAGVGEPATSAAPDLRFDATAVAVVLLFDATSDFTTLSRP